MKKLMLLVLLSAAALLSAGVTTFDNFRKGDRPLLIPEVQSYQAGKGVLQLPAKFTVAFPAGEEIILEQLAGELKRFPGIAVTAGGNDAFCRFVITEKDVPENPQGYNLVVDGKGITVTSRGTDGLFYGAQTLRNLIRNAAKPELEACVVTDWPDFEERSYSINIVTLPPERMPEFKRALDALASLKINRIFLRMDEAFPFAEKDLLPLRKRAFEAETIRDLHDFCRKRHIGIIPYMQVFSHAGWMTYHPDWNKMREDKKNPRDYRHNSQPCPLDMQARELTEKVIAEHIKFFDAKSIYICIDEIFLCPFHECDECLKHDPKDLLKDYMAFVYRVLDKYGATGIVCQDSFVDRHNWKHGDWFRTQLRKDNTVIRWWSYRDDLNEDSMAVFKGFRLFGNALNGKPFNVWNLARLIKKYGGTGCGMVHWYYSSGGVFSMLETETPDSLGGLVLGADYLWKVRKEYRPDLGYDGTFEMMRRLYPERLTVVPAGLNSVPVPLEGAVNCELAESGKFPRFASDAEVDELKKALAKLPERFELVTSPGGKYYALRLVGKGRNGRAGIKFPCGGRKAEYLSLLLTASRPENGMEYHGYRYGAKRYAHDPAAHLFIEYADGSKAKVPLRYRQELTDWNRPFGGFDMRFAVRGVDADKNYYSFGICDVKNPHPEKAIKAIAFGTERLDNISPALLALSFRGADKPFKKIAKPFDPAVLANREGVGADPAPEFQLRADFETGMGDVEVSAPKLAAKALKYEIIDDPTSLTKSKVLKITLPPGRYSGRAMDEGLIRISVDLPYRVAPEERAITAEVRVVNSAEDHVHASIYLLDHDMSYPKNRMFRIYPLADVGAK